MAPSSAAESRSALDVLITNLPLSLHLIASALFPIVTGAFASLSRPSSAARPPSSKRRKETQGDDSSASDSDDDDSDQDEESKMEGLAPSDALLFPVMAGSLLAGLYAIIHYFGASLLNRILGIYFAFMGVFSVGKMLEDACMLIGGVLWPLLYADDGRLWLVDGKRRVVFPLTKEIQKQEQRSGENDDDEEDDGTRTHPLPGALGRLWLDEGIAEELWTVRQALGQRYLLRAYMRGAGSLKTKLALRTLLTFSISLGIILYATFISTPWYLTNLQGFAFAYTALQLLSPTTFATGSLVLGALFFYDIYFVFYTPLMVGVATKLDVPIKLVFPRPEVAGEKPGLAMLGLGDVVIPGIMVGLSLRFDLWMEYLRKQTKIQTTKEGKQVEDIVKAKYIPVSGRWGDRLWTTGLDASIVVDDTALQSSGRTAEDKQHSPRSLAGLLPTFCKPYFTASLVGYVLGMTATLVIMHVFQHAQPALLYLVPGVLGSIWLTALARGEIGLIWSYSEMIDDDNDDSESKEKENAKKNSTDTHEVKNEGDTEAPEKKGWLADFFGKSIFGSDKTERSAKRLEKAIDKTVSMRGADASSKPDGQDKVKRARWISFSVSKVQSKKKATASATSATRSAPRSSAESRRNADSKRSSSGSSDDSAVLVSREDATTSSSGAAVGNGAKARNRSEKA